MHMNHYKSSSYTLCFFICKTIEKKFNGLVIDSNSIPRMTLASSHHLWIELSEGSPEGKKNSHIRQNASNIKENRISMLFTFTPLALRQILKFSLCSILFYEFYISTYYRICICILIRENYMPFLCSI